MSKQAHIIVVSGGVISGNGKGITAASIGACLKARGQKVNIQKFDMYLNVDAGTLKPGKHGEVFVTNDGAETDLDLGHYERFLDEELTQASSVMQGRVLLDVINKERAGGFKGDDVQVIPHVTTEIQNRIIEASDGFDVHIVELGGTVGDYEGLAFIEAVRQLPGRIGRQHISFVHVVYLPYLEVSAEIKTKPAQNAFRDLRSIGIIPDVIVARCERDIAETTMMKLSIFSSLPEDQIVVLKNASTIYEVPLMLEESGIMDKMARRLSIKTQPDLKKWRSLVARTQRKNLRPLRIGFVAKYMENLDTYYSVTEALKAAAWSSGCQLELDWVEAESLESMTNQQIHGRLRDYDGLVVPGGFGERGVEGMIAAARYSLRQNKPYLGLCLGMQVGTIAFARENGFKQANSTEFDKDCPQPVITTMEGQQGKEMTGGTMRLGGYPCRVTRGSRAHKAYGKLEISERHRHRFEFNPAYEERLVSKGLILSGRCPQNSLVEIIEMPKSHRFFLGTQYHPEFQSRPTRPHPLFVAFVEASKQA